MPEVLIIDDEEDIRELVSDLLEDVGYQTAKAANATQAIKYIEGAVPKAVILDIWLENSYTDGVGLLKLIKQKYSFVPVIMISGHGSIETAVQTIKLGAYDFIEKPFKSDKLLILLQRAVEAAELSSENFAFRNKELSQLEIIGNSKAIQNLTHLIGVVAPTNRRVFITGAPGVGKELLARMIHRNSKRSGKPFVVCNAAVLSTDRIEEELFGSVTKPGMLEQAAEGTLYLDEITELPPKAQTMLLQALQSGTYKRKDSGKEISTNARIISASSKSVEEAIKSGKLNSGLLYRLNVVSTHIPPLKDRKEDIERITDFFIGKFSQEFSTTVCKLSKDALAIMLAYDWPGNIRQLRNTAEWLVMNSQNCDEISADMLPYDILKSVTKAYHDIDTSNTSLISKPLKEAREIFERNYLIAQLERFGGNISNTANFIGMDRTALHRKIKNLNLDYKESVG